MTRHAVADRVAPDALDARWRSRRGRRRGIPPGLPRVERALTKCRGIGCPRRERCWRFLAPAAAPFQAYFRPMDSRGVCHNFFDAEARDGRR